VLEGDPKDPPVGAEWINRTLSERRVCVGKSADGTPQILSSALQRATGIRQDYRVSAYVSLLLSMSLGFAVAFQTPIVVLLLGWAGIVDRAFLHRYRKHALFGCAVAAAFLTPGDIPSMILMWVPLYGLYELGGLLLRLFPASRVAAGLIAKEPDGEPEE
jgi:Sec-independent protein secretion pathway component TatC